MSMSSVSLPLSKYLSADKLVTSMQIERHYGSLLVTEAITKKQITTHSQFIDGPPIMMEQLTASLI